ncbi:MAG: hypothetical protein ACPG61_13965 [Paracoccaceae bacterium]
MSLQEYLDAITDLPEASQAALQSDLQAMTGAMKFVPNPGPQTDAWFSPADVLLYGGQAGGGKSGLLCGLALQEHHQSLLMRRHGTDLEGGGGLIEELLRLNGYSGKPPPTLRTEDGRIITFGAAANLGDEQKTQGRARDLLGIDEASQFLEAQIRFLMGWVRTTKAGQRTRSIFATNPPLNNDGQWVIKMFRPWLDLTHPNPAEPGELRWFISTDDGDVEVDGPTAVEHDGRKLSPQSRTFIPAHVSDNPFILLDEYQKTLDGLPEPLRSAVRDGNFMAMRPDNPWQIIPTNWIREAQARWTPDPPQHAPMSAIGVDVAQGGADNTVLAPRYDGWFASLEVTPGVETPTGKEVAGLVVARMSHGAVPIIDLGGGYGGEAYSRLRELGIECRGHKGAEKSTKRTADQTLRFANKRTEVLWRFREALDPGQDGGSPIALPDDPELVSDLTSVMYTVTSNGIKAMPKDQVTRELGRSPDKGDAVCMAWSGGPRLLTHGNQWRAASKMSRPGAKPKVVTGRKPRRR